MGLFSSFDGNYVRLYEGVGAGLLYKFRELGGCIIEPANAGRGYLPLNFCETHFYFH